MDWYSHDFTSWGWVGMVVGMLALWGVLIAGVALLVRSLGASRQPSSSSVAARAPEQVLAERFARGDIDETEYNARVAVLRQPTRY
ncbi:MAG: SHOCT domain-containing protein [Nocardioidaceae bacterium]